MTPNSQNEKKHSKSYMKRAEMVKIIVTVRHSTELHVKKCQLIHAFLEYRDRERPVFCCTSRQTLFLHRHRTRPGLWPVIASRPALRDRAAYTVWQFRSIIQTQRRKHQLTSSRRTRYSNGFPWRFLAHLTMWRWWSSPLSLLVLVLWRAATSPPGA